MAGTVQFFVWPVKVFIVIGLFFYLMQILVNMHRNLRNLGRSDEPKIDAEKIDLSDIAF